MAMSETTVGPSGDFESLGGAALELAINAWRVIPLHGKRPWTAHGVLDATDDLDTVRRWWTRAPSSNIGAAVPLQLIVLDIDPRNGGDVTELGELPPTLTVWSGREDGGRHLYFFRPSGALTGARLPAGIDLKINGYCVMPPSIHPATGQAYRWEERPLAALPPRVRELLRPLPRPPQVARATGNGKGLVEFVESAKVGNRNNALFWAACRAAEGGVFDNLVGDLVAAAVNAGENETAAWTTAFSARGRY
jgi:Bifunctional DNA primase/polymerase, N-terminal